MDNGKEFGEHEAISEALGAGFDFAHPPATWERGPNENTNDPSANTFQKMNFNNIITRKQLNWAMRKLNNRSRKTLGHHSPY